MKFFSLVSTPIAGTSDSISRMQIACSADAGNYVSMQIDENFDPVENAATFEPASVTITAECSSVDMQWYYVGVSEGQTIRQLMTSVKCEQIPTLRACSPTALTYGVGDNDKVIDVDYSE